MREWIRLGAALVLLAGCATPRPRAIAYGDEQCERCHMPISDPRFAAEAVTTTGKIKVYDDIGCMAASVGRGELGREKVHALWVADFLSPGTWLGADQAVFLLSDTVKTPMSHGVVALRPGAGADSLRAVLGGRLVPWDAVVRRAVGEEGA